MCSVSQLNKSKIEMTRVLAGMSNIYIRTDFCQWVFGLMGKGVSLNDAKTKCSQVNAGYSSKCSLHSDSATAWP